VFDSMTFAIFTAVSVLLSLLGCDNILSGREVLHFRRMSCLHPQHQLGRYWQ
jgi:uncharacterized lipoprotein NlpE involved in copper resistance